MTETKDDLLTSMGFDTALNINDLDACVDRLADRVVLLTQERDALLEDAVRMRATGDALYDGMDCQACRISIGIEFCAQCDADREQWCNLAPIISRTAEGSP